VDDEADIGALLSTALGRVGYDVATACDGMDALAAIAALPPDLVILDVRMPRLDGLETLKRLRADPATTRVPVIMLTTRAEAADRLEGLSHGADDYLAKPFDLAEVLERVKTLIGR
jgi:two-component system OmpR family response regulator